MTDSGDGRELSADDLALDHRLALLSGSFRFLLDITPVDADDLRDGFLEGRDPAPDFTYRELETDPEVVRAELDSIELGAIEDPVLGQLLRAKHREMELQLDMLQARDSDDFLPLSVELYGGVSPSLRRQAEGLLASITTTEPSGDRPRRRGVPGAGRGGDRALPRRGPRPRHARRDPGRRQRRHGLRRRPAHRPRDQGAAGARRGAAPPRGRHPPRHPGQRQPPADQGAGRRARGLRRDPGGAGRARRDRVRRAHRVPAAPARQPGRHRAPDDRRGVVRRGPRARWSTTTSPSRARTRPSCASIAPAA